MSSDLIGLSQDRLDTPHLLLDLDLFEHNIRHISSYCQRHGCGWRPHSKAHKSPDIAHMQLRAGALGITCAKLSEAEMMVRHGIERVLLANQLTTQSKWDRLAQLLDRAEVIVSIDDAAVLPWAAQAAGRYAVNIPLVLELDVGMGRVGLQDLQATVSLAEQIHRDSAFTFRGLMGYEGHVLNIKPAHKKEAACKKAIGILLQARDALEAKGVACDIISAGGTGSYMFTAAIPGVTEVQAGGGIFMDTKYRDEFYVEDLHIALRAVTTVTSHRPGQLVTDAGFKTLSAHHGPPLVLSHEGIGLEYLSAEHGVYSVAQDRNLPALGERLELALGYTDSTTVLHDQIVGVRERVIEKIFPLEGRGLLT